MSAALLVLPGHDGPLELDADVLQGSWTEEQYLRLTDRTNRLIELLDGRLEALPMPTDEHQGLLLWLADLLRAAVGSTGVVRVAPMRLRLRSGRYREPDLLALRDATDARRHNQAWTGADLVVEIVSPDDPDRDYVDKRVDYAQAGVGEYWIVDPARQTVAVLLLDDDRYREHAVAGATMRLASATIPGLTLDVGALFAAAAPPPA
ncbi:MAG: Uma2 family endonuclease [Chloroflexi bacterium]|nr:Uma2 family endonuclease [Chloroflexota bacterium]